MQQRFLCPRHHKVVFGAIGGLATALAVISTAWACTVFYGNITISGNSPSNIQHTITGDPGSNAQWVPDSPQGAYMQWCNYNAANNSNGSFWTAAVDDSAPFIELQVSADTLTTSACNYQSLTNGNKLTASNNYHVATHDRFMGPGGGTNNSHNCHGQTHGDSVLTSNFVVDAAGAGSGSWNLPVPFFNGWSSICVYLEDSNLASFAPGIASNFQSV